MISKRFDLGRVALLSGLTLICVAVIGTFYLFRAEQRADNRVIETLTCFDRELADQPRVLTLPLHPHVEGVPHRIPYLERVLDMLMARPDTIFMTGSQIADWYVGLQIEDPLL